MFRLSLCVLISLFVAQSLLAETPSLLTREEQAIILKKHNEERALVNKPALEWDDAVAAHAQAWANKLAESGAFEHAPRESRNEEGENLHRTSRDDRAYEVTRCSVAWAEEKLGDDGQSIYVAGMTYMDYTTKYPGKTIGHWTQMIWGKSTKLGVGIAQIKTGDKKGGWIVVARYSPAGNTRSLAP